VSAETGGGDRPAERTWAGLPGEPEAFDRNVLPPPVQGRGLIALDGALALISVLLVVQMWLVTAALESYLAGHFEVPGPAAILSGLLFAGCLGLSLFVDRVDREVRRR
jgi:hypothetical protein